MTSTQEFNKDNATIVRSYPKVPHPTRLTLRSRANPVLQFAKFIGFCSLIMGMVIKGHDPKQQS